MDFIGDAIKDGMQWLLENTIYRLLYYVSTAVCWIIDVLYEMIEVFIGMEKVSYDGEKDFLLNIFFSNQSVSNIYWGMALIGIVLCFVFAIIAVIRKMFDGEGKIQRTLGAILGSGLKSVLMILLVTALLSFTLSFTNVLTQRITFLFNNADHIHTEEVVTYTDEEYAAMTRILHIVGNYSLSPAATSRYNINSCYNELRPDLEYLQEQGVFEVYYETLDEDGEIKDTWQSALQKLANANDVRYELYMDVYNESVTNAIVDIMELVDNYGGFFPLEKYKQTTMVEENVSLDTFLFLSSTLRAAKNSMYNEKANLGDAIRGPYFIHEKDIYDFDSVVKDFDIGVGSFDYIIIFVAGYFLIKELAVILVNCAGRIFNLIFLYLVAPLFISTMANDDGVKAKNWMIAFIIQTFSILGIIISLRVFLLFMPIVLDSRLELFSNTVLNITAKIVIIISALITSRKSSAMMNGILADMAGHQSIIAGDNSQEVRGSMKEASEKIKQWREKNKENKNKENQNGQSSNMVLPRKEGGMVGNLTENSTSTIDNNQVERKSALPHKEGQERKGESIERLNSQNSKQRALPKRSSPRIIQIREK